MQNICYLHAVEKVRDVGLVASCIHEGIVTMTLTGGLRPHGLPSAARVVSGLPSPAARDFVSKFKQQIMACLFSKGGGGDGCGGGGDDGSGCIVHS